MWAQDYTGLTEAQAANRVVRSLSRKHLRLAFGTTDRQQAALALQQARAQAWEQARSEPITPELIAERAAAMQITDRRRRRVARIVHGLERLSTAAGVAAIGLLFPLAIMAGVAKEGVAITWVGTLFWVSVVAWFGLMMVGSSVERIHALRARARLLNWAVQRPGQLARGLPGLNRREQGVVRIPVSANPWASVVSILLRWMGGAVVCFGALGVMFGLMGRDGLTLSRMFVVLLIGAIIYVAGRLLSNRAYRQELLDEELSASLDWVWEDAFKAIDDQHRSDASD